jgi:hypothetical protein
MSENVTDDLQLLAQSLLDQGKCVVVFDGAPGAGKTTLMKDIARCFHLCAHIDVDDFLDRGQGTFIDAIRFDELRMTISDALADGQFVLVASACARAVINRLGVPNAVFVYVKRDDESNSSESLAEEYGEIESERPFNREIEEYHRDYQPYRTANFRYIRKTQN